MNGEKFNPNFDAGYPSKDDPEEKARLAEAIQRGRELSKKIGQNSERNLGKPSWERRRDKAAVSDAEPTPRKLLRQAIERGLRVAEHNDNYFKPEEEIDLDEFTKMLESMIEKDRWIGEHIRGWNLIPMKSGKIKEPVFKLVVEFNDYGRKIFQGTHKDILAGLNAELDRLEVFEQGEAAEE